MLKKGFVLKPKNIDLLESRSHNSFRAYTLVFKSVAYSKNHSIVEASKHFSVPRATINNH